MADESDSVSDDREPQKVGLNFWPRDASISLDAPNGTRRLQFNASLQARHRMKSGSGESMDKDNWIILAHDEEPVPYAKDHDAIGLIHSEPDNAEHLIAFALSAREFDSLLELVKRGRLPQQIRVTVKDRGMKLDDTEYMHPAVIWTKGAKAEWPLVFGAHFYVPLVEEPEQPPDEDVQKPIPDATTGAILQLERNVRKEIAAWRTEIRRAMIWGLIGLALYLLFRH
jgi:hypothetical protein